MVRKYGKSKLLQYFLVFLLNFIVWTCNALAIMDVMMQYEFINVMYWWSCVSDVEQGRILAYWVFELNLEG